MMDQDDKKTESQTAGKEGRHAPYGDGTSEDAAAEALADLAAGLTTAPAEEAEAALRAAQADIAQLKDQLLRSLAESENTRKRAQREREDAFKFSISGFARDLLPVADNLRRALGSADLAALPEGDPLKGFLAGVEMTEKQLLTAFERHGLKRIEAKGGKFDSHYHQAMLEVPSEAVPPGTVLEVMQEGYLLHDRLLRPALVSVAKASG